MLFYLILFLGVIAVSSASTLIKLCDAPALVIATYRMALASLFFVITARLKKKNPIRDLSKKDLFFTILAGLFLTLHFSTWITSLKYTSVAISVVLLSTSPIFVTLGSVLFLKKKPGKAILISIVFTIAGCLMMTLSETTGPGNSLRGIFLALLGAVGAGGYFLSGSKVRQQIDTVSYVAVVYTISAITLVAITLFFQHPLLGYDNRTYLLFLSIAMIPQVLGHTSLNWALERLSAMAVSVTALGEPIGAILLAFIILGENITLKQSIGGFLILAGVTLTLYVENRKRT